MNILYVIDDKKNPQILNISVYKMLLELTSMLNFTDIKSMNPAVLFKQYSFIALNLLWLFIFNF